jgi:putative addiction module CopG family antidote
MILNALPADLEHFIRQEVARGKYPSEADLIAEAVRLLRERERRTYTVASITPPSFCRN